jgi:predicted nucleic acid-binding protein
VTVVVDASAMVAALTHDGAQGQWVRGMLREGRVLAPHLLGVEVANTLRRIVRSGSVTTEHAHVVIAGLLAQPIELVGFASVAVRVWELRDTVSSYDAWYVAVAEAARVPLVTLDARLARASGPRCDFEVGP